MKELIQIDNRRPTRKIMVGNIPIGDGNPISIQTMTTTLTRDVDATLAQVERCAEAGAQIVRVAVPEAPDAEALSAIVRRASVPIVSDIHFNYRYALAAVDAGVAKVRINPGNIGNEERISEVLSAAKAANIPIRIGVNEGSLERDLLEKYPSPTAEALVESAMRHVNICEDHDFTDIAISVKSSDPLRMIAANRQLSAKVPYPLHLGVTEAGTPRRAHVKSTLGIGTLLQEGIGDTVRISITGDPVEEVLTAKELLRALGMAADMLDVVSCPFCGRGDPAADYENIVTVAEALLEKHGIKIPVAVMGCEVNGPGETRNAEVGIHLGGKELAVLKVRGERVRTFRGRDEVNPEFLANALLEAAQQLQATQKDTSS
ncbi:MAG: flavodoxin-dependent (E)-4-hydroxy-3-methylbut-2-enyl-diphosphate synthase [Candidatus Poribacteria bacterium]|nr:flavodoxin-dependent (E)-4-hydroxy-3-methylbut-2-enyl-diphosphate synthase [Candidatus Poribacteria bacterium]